MLSSSPRIVIVGAVAGGATAAARARRLDEHASITLLERGGDVSFANCGMPYYLAGEITDRNRLVLSEPAQLASMISADVRVHHSVVAIDRAAQVVHVNVRGGPSGVRIPYDSLLLATGAAPVTHGIGNGVPGVFTLRTLADMDAIDAWIRRVTASAAADNRRARAIICGAGFVGLEMVEAFTARGLDVVLVERGAHVLPGALDSSMTNAITAELSSRGVAVLTDCSVASVALNEGLSGVAVTLESGTVLPADIVLLSMGVAPESSLARDAGLELDPHSHAIIVDEYMRTSDPHIYAVGDAIATQSLVLPKQRVWVPLGGPANRQGRIAAESMLLGDAATETYRGTLGTAIVRVFDVVAGVTGLTEAAAAAAGVKTASVIVSGVSHASYYPRAQPVTVKVVWNTETGVLLGSQVTGSVDGVDKRVDVLATAISLGRSVDDLAHLELSYAPPFGVARDVINTAGFAAQNVRAGRLRPARELGGASRVVVDVRDATTASLHPLSLPTNNASEVLSIPLEQLRNRTGEVVNAVARVGGGADAVTTVCGLGKLSYMASRILEHRGVPRAASLVGGLASLAPTDAQLAAARTRALSLAVHGRGYELDGGDKVNSSYASPTSSKGALDLVEVCVDACGIACPGPIMAVRKALSSLAPGQEMKVTATDAGFASDFPALCRSAGMEMISVHKENGVVTGRLRRPSNLLNIGTTNSATSPLPTQSATVAADGNANDVAIVVFSGELDKVLAAFVIANGAVAMGAKRVTMFFTFWGLSALREPAGRRASESTTKTDQHASAASTAISFVDTALGAMLPHGPAQLHLSHLDYGGLGAKAMQRVMEAKHLPTLPALLRTAQESGVVRLVACTMSMSALGVSEGELLEGVELGGVADFLAAASAAKTTLFI